MTNTSTDQVFYFVADKETLALLDWAACTDPSRDYCTYVEPRATKRIGYSQFLGEGATGSQAVVYHWRLVPTTPGKFTYDSIRSLEVDLR